MVASRAVPGIPGATACPVATLPEHLAEGRPYSPIGEIANDAMLLTAKGIGRFLVTADRIDYAAEPGADPIYLDRFLWGSARSALIHLRGEFPLHASVVKHPYHDVAVALCGVSGVGKSSMAAAMAQHGWTTIADDQARLTPMEAEVRVWPGPALARLCPKTCGALGIDTDGLAIDSDDRAKRLLPLLVPPSASRLVAVIELTRSDAPAFFGPLRRGDALATLSRHVVGQRKWRGLRTAEERFRTLDAVARRTLLFRLARHAEESILGTGDRLWRAADALASQALAL